MGSASRIGHERRAEERHGVNLAVTVRAYRVAPIDGRMVDLSEGGAMVALTGDEIARGDEILIAMRGIEIVATIAWATAEFCGLAFHRRLHATELSVLRRAGRARVAEPGAPPGLPAVPGSC